MQICSYLNDFFACRFDMAAHEPPEIRRNAYNLPNYSTWGELNHTLVDFVQLRSFGVNFYRQLRHEQNARTDRGLILSMQNCKIEILCILKTAKWIDMKLYVIDM